MFPSLSSPAGECYLMEWSDWSSCVSICVKAAGVDFGSVQVRSRAVLAQEPENLQQCPDQAWESQPCTGKNYSRLSLMSTLRGFEQKSPNCFEVFLKFYCGRRFHKLQPELHDVSFHNVRVSNSQSHCTSHWRQIK